MPILKKNGAPAPQDAPPASGEASGEETSVPASLPLPRPTVPEGGESVTAAPDAMTASASPLSWQSILPNRPSLLDLIHFEEPAPDGTDAPPQPPQLPQLAEEEIARDRPRA
jgi:hypothetical protein